MGEDDKLIVIPIQKQLSKVKKRGYAKTLLLKDKLYGHKVLKQKMIST